MSTLAPSGYRSLTTIMSDASLLSTERPIDHDVINNGSSPVDDVESLGLFDALIGLWFPGMLSVFGIIGNALSLWVLSRDRARSATMTSLKALAVSDLVLLIGALCQQMLPLSCNFTGMTRTWLCMRSGYVQVYAWPVVCAAQMASVWLTVLISTERYLAVCAPLSSFCRADSRVTTVTTVRSAMVGQGRVFRGILVAMNMEQAGRVFRAVLVIVLASIAFNVPRFFEFKPVLKNITNVDQYHHQPYSRQEVIPNTADSTSTIIATIPVDRKCDDIRVTDLDWPVTSFADPLMTEDCFDSNDESMLMAICLSTECSQLPLVIL